MAIIGKITPNTNGKADWPFKGHIACRAISSDLGFKKTNQTHPDAPKYTVHGTANGRTFELGSAWEKTDKNGNMFLSITLDDMMMEKPLHVSAFSDKNGGHDVVWSRPRQNGSKTAEEKQ